MRFKLHPPSGIGLCITCSNGQVMTFDHGENVTMCGNQMVPMRVTKTVVQCTDYVDRAHDNEHEMRQIAWILRTEKRGEMGFKPPKKSDDD